MKKLVKNHRISSSQNLSLSNLSLSNKNPPLHSSTTQNSSIVTSSDIIHHLETELSKSILHKLEDYTNVNDDIFQQIIAGVISEEITHNSITLSQKRQLALNIFNRMRKLDILQPLMDDPTVTEIMVNGPNIIFIEKEGKLFPSPLTFPNHSSLENMIMNFFSQSNRPLNEFSPIADLRLPDGSRANAILPPIAPDGPIFTIRKFTGFKPLPETLIQTNFISQIALDFLANAIKTRKTLMLCGGTGSGKTTFLNILSSFIPKNERIVTIEDSAELSLQGIPNLVRLESRMPGPDGKGEISISQLIRNALRLRPNRIIVGEVRGSEAADMLQAIHTGHPGSLCTAHGNSCLEMLDRLATMVLAGSKLPFEAIQRQIALGFDYIIHITRSMDGKRYVDEIVQVGMIQNNNFTIIPLFLNKEGKGLEKQ